MRINRFTLLMSEEERQMLKSLSIIEHRSESEMVRALIYEAQQKKSIEISGEKQIQHSAIGNELIKLNKVA